MYSGGVMIQDSDDRRAWSCGVGPEPTLERMKAEIEKFRKIRTVLSAWIREDEQQIVWFENYTNGLGFVRRDK